jgi:predicted O-methyltransferase YrrM
VGAGYRAWYLRHPLFAWLNLRPVIAQHTQEENALLRRWAHGRKSLVEIGVAEGASALALHETMSPNGVLYLIDPFHLSRLPFLNSEKRVARRTATSSRNGRVVWVEQFSPDAAASWNTSLDFLFFDGDHSEGAVRRDWIDWHRFVVPGGIVAFHDARLFPGGWTSHSFGSVVVVDELFRGVHALSHWRIVDERDSLVIVERCS